ncbi:hypothetical protein PJI17_31110, partial [Mycobacterium kansasii]
MLIVPLPYIRLVHSWMGQKSMKETNRLNVQQWYTLLVEVFLQTTNLQMSAAMDNGGYGFRCLKIEKGIERERWMERYGEKVPSIFSSFFNFL